MGWSQVDIDRVGDLTAHLAVSGHVQGVGFRRWFARAAGALGVTGWVRNEDSGDVTALLSGDPLRVTLLVRMATAGPSKADVMQVVARPTESSPTSSFEVLDG
ncbi:acylphosphatase [Natronosporangium hydrolyticum]|uniref:Acylphosphatase n=2 Tax=Natronosporangium hydrolyticum TaxID=2811111 RepID=A0A895YP55_9ACTN|nr:acylphosphatase [Natronosporangium hydrolyticum]